jgi:dTDP-4-amino-4,6-dideoxygalactose transaminase
MRIQFADLRSQYLSIRPEIDAAVASVLDSSEYVGGRHVRAFEQAFAASLGLEHCVGVGNGSDALCLALRALGIGPGDEVITTAFSFFATAEAIGRTGARPVFVDCDEGSYNLDPERLAGAITPRTRAVVPVHLFGRPADMDPILALAALRGLPVVEDAAQAHGARYRGRPVGSLGIMGCFSFYPGKNLGAYGDAGAMVTRDPDLADKVRRLADHGRIGRYDHESEGLNSRLDGLQAAILEVKLRHLEGWNARRREIADRYDKGLSGLAGLPDPAPESEQARHLYVVRVPNRDQAREVMTERGVATAVHYPIPIPFLKAYAHLGYKPGDFPAAERLKDEVLSLPNHAGLSDSDADHVIESLRAAVGK